MDLISPYEFTILALASGRVAFCVATEDIFQPFRERLQERDQLRASPWDGEGFLLGLFTCPWCLSAWTSALAIGAWWLAPQVALAVALPFAVWAAATVFVAKGFSA